MSAKDEWLLNKGDLYSRFDRTRQSCSHELYSAIFVIEFSDHYVGANNVIG